MELAVMSPVLNGTNFEESVKYLSSLGVDSIEIGAGGYPGTAHINPAECLESPAKVKEIKDILKKYKEEFHVSDEAFKSMSDQWNSVLKSEDILKKQSEAERLIKDAQGQLEENKPLMEQIRKWSEAYKKSCRL